MGRRILILILFLATLSCLAAQKRAITKEQMEDARRGVDFKKTKTEWRLRKYDVLESKPKEKKLKEPRSSDPVLGKLFGLIGYILIGLLVIGILYFAIKEFRKEKKTVLEHSDLDDIEDIEKTDLEVYLAEAIAQKDYRLILRIKFLMILKELSLKGLIVWKKHKTNRTYSRELASTAVSTEFRAVAAIFDRVWYGLHAVDAERYDTLHPSFDSLLKGLKDEE